MIYNLHSCFCAAVWQLILLIYSTFFPICLWNILENAEKTKKIFLLSLYGKFCHFLEKVYMKWLCLFGVDNVSMQ